MTSYFGNTGPVGKYHDCTGLCSTVRCFVVVISIFFFLVGICRLVSNEQQYKGYKIALITNISSLQIENSSASLIDTQLYDCRATS